jgi:hypothetical protein
MIAGIARNRRPRARSENQNLTADKRGSENQKPLPLIDSDDSDRKNQNL